jgi:hypothetical protein
VAYIAALLSGGLWTHLTYNRPTILCRKEVEMHEGIWGAGRYLEHLRDPAAWSNSQLLDHGLQLANNIVVNSRL